MKTLITLFASISLLIGSTAALAGAHKNEPADTMVADDGAQQHKGKKGGKDKHANAHDDDKDDHDDDNDDEDGHDNDDGDDSDDDDDDDDRQRDKGTAEQGKGNERSQEMRDRRDERKEIQNDYRADREPGQESTKGEDGKPTKKPWYKFWE